VLAVTRWDGHAVGLDVHRDFCAVAVCEDGVVRSARPVASTPDGIRTLAASLLSSDRVALEVTGGACEVARLLEPHVDRVVVVSPDDSGIVQARATTDRLDARTLARLLWRGELESVWMPDQRCRVLRRRLARREGLLRARSRAKNEIQAVLRVSRPFRGPTTVRQSRESSADWRRGAEARGGVRQEWARSKPTQSTL
jgi:transposase